MRGTLTNPSLRAVLDRASSLCHFHRHSGARASANSGTQLRTRESRDFGSGPSDHPGM